MNIKIKVEKELYACKEVWEKFSTKETIWDEWDVMMALFNPEIHEAYFLVLDNGLLALQYNKKGEKYELFGGMLPESRPLWIEAEDFMKVYKELPQPYALIDLDKTFAENIMEKIPETKTLFELTDYRFFLIPEEMNYNFLDHLSKWDKEKRNNFLSDLKKIRAQEPKIIWNDEDLSEEFLRMNQERFKEESDYKDEENKEEIRRFIKTIKEKKLLHSIRIEVAGKIEAVCMSAYHQEIFHVLYGASNPAIKNLGKLMYVECINKANELKAKEINFMVGQGTWKEQWRMNKEACYSLRKK